jgi:hypothetical protein
MEMLLMLLEDTEKNTVIGECQIVVLYFLLIANTESWNVYSMECDGMLAVHTVQVMYGWKRRSLKSLKDSLPSVLDGLQLVQVSIMLPYTIHYKNSSCIPTTLRRRKGLYHIMHLQNMQSVNGFLQQLDKERKFTAEILFTE